MQGFVGVVQVLACTRTGVLDVPEFTVTTTCPSLPEMAVAVTPPVAKAMPPTEVLNEKLTVFPLSGLPPVSTTLNATLEDSCLPAPPVPFKVMLVGVAETNCIEPIDGAITVNDADEDTIPLTEAVTVSVPAQPLSRYDPVAVPFTVTALALSTALPLVAQGDVKVTVWV